MRVIYFQKNWCKQTFWHGEWRSVSSKGDLVTAFENKGNQWEKIKNAYDWKDTRIWPRYLTFRKGDVKLAIVASINISWFLLCKIKVCSSPLWGCQPDIILRHCKTVCQFALSTQLLTTFWLTAARLLLSGSVIGSPCVSVAQCEPTVSWLDWSVPCLPLRLLSVVLSFLSVALGTVVLPLFLQSVNFRHCSYFGDE